MITKKERSLPLYCAEVDKSAENWRNYPQMVVHPARSREGMLVYLKGRYNPPFPVGRCYRMCEAGEWLKN